MAADERSSALSSVAGGVVRARRVPPVVQAARQAGRSAARITSPALAAGPAVETARSRLAKVLRRVLVGYEKTFKKTAPRRLVESIMNNPGLVGGLAAVPVGYLLARSGLRGALASFGVSSGSASAGLRRRALGTLMQKKSDDNIGRRLMEEGSYEGLTGFLGGLKRVLPEHSIWDFKANIPPLGNVPVAAIPAAGLAPELLALGVLGGIGGARAIKRLGGRAAAVRRAAKVRKIQSARAAELKEMSPLKRQAVLLKERLPKTAAVLPDPRNFTPEEIAQAGGATAGAGLGALLGGAIRKKAPAFRGAEYLGVTKKVRSPKRMLLGALLGAVPGFFAGQQALSIAKGTPPKTPLERVRSAAARADTPYHRILGKYRELSSPSPRTAGGQMGAGATLASAGTTHAKGPLGRLVGRPRLPEMTASAKARIGKRKAEGAARKDIMRRRLEATRVESTPTIKREGHLESARRSLGVTPDIMAKLEAKRQKGRTRREALRRQLETRPTMESLEGIRHSMGITPEMRRREQAEKVRAQMRRDAERRRLEAQMEQMRRASGAPRG